MLVLSVEIIQVRTEGTINFQSEIYCSQESTTGPSPDELDELSPCPTPYFLEVRANVIPPFMPVSPK